MIYGVTGYVGSGKDTVVAYLVKHGFIHASLSDEIRIELKNHNTLETRDHLINMGNNLREQYGANILAQRAFSRVKKYKNSALSSIRNIEEIKYLQSQPDFKLIFIDADQKIRFERILSRHRIGDCENFQEFVDKEKQEESEDKNSQQMHKIKAYADIVIENNTTINNLHKQIKEKILL